MLHRSTIRQNNSYGNTWLAMHSDIPSGIVRAVQASLYIDTPVWVRLFQCKNNKLTVILSTEYGDIDITVNLSEPEKDPKAIAAAKNAKQSGYPKCLLCKENEGYAGRLNHPA